MIRGLYTAASGMLAEMKRFNIIANNLANVNTTGFKEDFATFRQLREMRIHRVNDPTGFKKIDLKPHIGNLGLGTQLERTYIDFSQGSLKRTNNRFDVAIEGEGFFTIETEEGIRYTRNGAFALDNEGYLITKDGHRVLGEGGPIQLFSEDVTITETGEVWEGEYFVDFLRIANFEDKTLMEKSEEGVFTYQGDPEDEIAAAVKVNQGFLEVSNVNAVKEMVKMINVTRAYEANQRVIRTHDELLGKAVNDVARI